MENNNNNVNIANNNPKKKFNILWVVLIIVGALLVTTMLSKIYEVAMNFIYNIVYGEDAEYYGATESYNFDNDDNKNSSDIKVNYDNEFTVYCINGESYQYQASDWIVGKTPYMLTNYKVEHENLTESQIYAHLDDTHTMYMETHDEFFNDYTGYDAVQMLNDVMRNDLNLPIKIEGQILSIEGEGNIFRIYDIFDDYEGIYAYDNNIVPDILDCYIDVSLVDNNEDFYVNDYVTIYAETIGKLPMQNGSYCPYIVAVAIELQ